MNTVPFYLRPRKGEIIPKFRNYANNVEGIVIVLDALGMKNALEDYTPEDVFDRWNKVIHEFEYTISTLGKNAIFRVFSDTIIITYSNNGYQTPDVLINNLCNVLINNIIYGIKNGIPFRGAMSDGPYHESSELVLGYAINQAANCYEKGEWIGISWSPNIQMPKSNGKPISYYPLIEYNIPYKDRKIVGLALNWVFHNNSIDCINILGSLRDKKINNNSVRIKYDNSIEFYNFIRSLRQ